MKSLLPADTEVVVSGKFTRRYNEIQATDYEFELFEEGHANSHESNRSQISAHGETHGKDAARLDADGVG